MKKWTVEFLEDCDNQDSRGVYRKGTILDLREDSAQFWISRKMAKRVSDQPGEAVINPVAQAETEIETVAANLTETTKTLGKGRDAGKAFASAQAAYTSKSLSDDTDESAPQDQAG